MGPLRMVKTQEDACTVNVPCPLKGSNNPVRVAYQEDGVTIRCACPIGQDQRGCDRLFKLLTNEHHEEDTEDNIAKKRMIMSWATLTSFPDYYAKLLEKERELELVKWSVTMLRAGLGQFLSRPK